uniref:Charged multivesicular body protein 2b n=1 Tax=Mus spicilegus TaxID=10103 RepID=A0A8C6GAX3_MUSSI
MKSDLLRNVIKEQNRELRGTQRAIIRDRAALEKQEKQLELEIKKMAKIGNKEACRVLAKQLVHLRKQKTRTFAVSSKVTSMSTQTKVMNSQMKMAGAMSTTAKTMQAVNKKMDPQKTLQTMQNFQKENMKMEMTEEMINDTLDDIFDGSDDEEESQDIVNQVLDEIGIEISGKVRMASSHNENSSGHFCWLFAWFLLLSAWMCMSEESASSVESTCLLTCFSPIFVCNVDGQSSIGCKKLTVCLHFKGYNF